MMVYKMVGGMSMNGQNPDVAGVIEIKLSLVVRVNECAFCIAVATFADISKSKSIGYT